MGLARALVLALCAPCARGARVVDEAVRAESASGGQRANDSTCAGVSQEVLQTHRRCSASLREPSVLRRFPNLGRDWCDQQLKEIAGHQCDSEGKDGLRFAAMVEVSFRRITALIGSSEEALIADKAWESCSSRQHSCLECESRYAGAREYLATTHACEWRAGACVRSDRPQARPWGKAATACGEDPVAGSHLELGQGVSGRDNRGQKKVAFLAGITYTGANRLLGPYTDIKNIFRLLTQRKGFDAESIFVLYDEGNPSDFRDPSTGKQAVILPTRGKWDGGAASFWELVHWVSAASVLGPGDFFMFFFSGHGVQTSPGSAPDELDGRDEWVASHTLDQIKDDDFYRFLVTIPAGVSVTAVADACHSEGFSDLPFNYLPGKVDRETLFWGRWQRSTFDVQREWCVDLVRAPDALPRAHITFISGSQNEQTSADLGESLGGAFTSYALAYWAEKTDEVRYRFNLVHRAKWLFGYSNNYNGGGGWERGTENSLFNRFKSMLKDFKHHGFPQEPNVCMWPSMSDSVDFDPFTPPSDLYGTKDYDIARHPFAGGPRPSRNADMVVPPICHHGGREEKAEAIKRQSVRVHHLDIREGLRLAAEPYHEAGPCEGWDTRYELQLSPSASNAGHNGITLSETAPDVVSYVDPFSHGRLAGVRIGDVIRSVGGKSFSEMSSQAKGLALRRGGQLVVLGTRG